MDIGKVLEITNQKKKKKKKKKKKHQRCLQN